MGGVMKKINYPLLIGGLIFLFFMAAAMFPELFTDRDPMFEEPPRNMEVLVEGEVKDEFTMHPIWPSEHNLMGTDVVGRDIYARLIYGTRNTLRLGFYIALFRILLALPVGVLAGMGRKFFGRMILFFNTYFSAVPILVISFLIFRMNFFRTLQIDRAILIYAVILAVLGWSKVAGIIEDAVKLIMEEDFIEGQIAIGKSWFQIIRQNIIPHVVPTALANFFKEAGQGIFLVAQLAVLGIFVGTIREVKTLAFRASYEMSIEPEWGSMLMKLTSQLDRFQDNWWLVVFPVLTFTLAVLGLNLLGEGLRIEFNKRNSRFVSNIRKAYFILSPRVLLMELRNIRKYWKPVVFKTGSVAVLLVFFLVPSYKPLGDFSLDNARAHLIELVDEKYEGRVSGSEGGYEAGQYIIHTMESYGFETNEFPIQYTYKNENPERDVDFALTYNTPLIMKEAKITLTGSDGIEYIYDLHKDFSVLEVPMDYDRPGKKIVKKGKVVDLEGEEYRNDDMSLIPVIYLGIDDVVLGRTEYAGIIGNTERAEFLVVDGHESRSNAYSSYKLTIVPFGELKEKLEEESADVVIEYTIPEIPKKEGRIIESWLLPEGKTMEDHGQTLIIGVPYDGLRLSDGTSSVEGTTAVATALEIARAVTEEESGYDKPILFLFFDRESDLLGGNFNDYYMRHAEVSSGGGYMYLEIMGAGLKGDKEVDLVAYFGQLNKEESFRSLLRMESILGEMKVPYTRYQGLLPTEDVLQSTAIYKTVSRQLLNFRTNAHLAVGIGKAYHNQKGTPEDTLENLNLKKMESIGQVITDLIISRENFGLGER